MSWDMTDLNAVVETAKPVITPPPAGNYTLRLLGVKPDTYRPDNLAFDLVIEEGQFKGRRIFPTLPNPSQYAWAGQAAKKLASALGITQQSGETVPQMFNRAAQNGHARFGAELLVEEYNSNSVDENGTPIPKAKSKLQWFTASAVA